MRLKVTVSDTNRLCEVRDVKSGRRIEGVTGVKFDSNGTYSKLIVEIRAPYFDLEFVKDEQTRKDAGFSEEKETQ